MILFRHQPPPPHLRPCVLTIGNFDGVHRGHQALLAQLRALSGRMSLPPCVLSFDPHPREFFAHRHGAGSAPLRIQTLRDKLCALEAQQIERVGILRFDDRLASMSAQDFVDELLVSRLQARALLVGDDFRFGARRAGDIALLETLGPERGFSVHRVDTQRDDGLRISSSALRLALSVGDMERVRRLIGGPYFISGHVVHGRKLGRTLGFPTMNLRFPRGTPALSGIFIVRAHGLVPGHALDAVASMGTRPAVETDGRTLLEVHVLDPPAPLDAYGKLVRVEFLKRLRPELDFDGLDALRAQIARDCDDARAWFAQHDHSGPASPARP